MFKNNLNKLNNIYQIEDILITFRNFFKSYFIEIYEKTTPDKNFSRQIKLMKNISDKLVTL